MIRGGQNGPKWPKNGPCYALRGVSHGTKQSMGTSFAIEGGFNPVGRVHKGFVTILGCFGPILAYFGPFSVPGANGAIFEQ